MSNNRLNCCCGQGRICPTHGDTTPEERIKIRGSKSAIEILQNLTKNSNMNINQANNNETPQEKARRIGVPVIPKLPENQPNYDPNPIVAICGECNREVRQLEGYYCGNPRCPLTGHITS